MSKVHCYKEIYCLHSSQKYKFLFLGLISYPVKYPDIYYMTTCSSVSYLKCPFPYLEKIQDIYNFSNFHLHFFLYQFFLFCTEPLKGHVRNKILRLTAVSRRLTRRLCRRRTRRVTR